MLWLSACERLLGPDSVSKQVDGEARHRRNRLPHRGQFGPNGRGDCRIVKPANREVTRDVQSALMRGADETSRHIVIRSENRAGR